MQHDGQDTTKDEREEEPEFFLCSLRHRGSLFANDLLCLNFPCGLFSIFRKFGSLARHSHAPERRHAKEVDRATAHGRGDLQPDRNREILEKNLAYYK